MSNLDAVGSAIDGAEDVLPPVDTSGEPPLPKGPRHDGLPDDCPITPLGLMDDLYFYLDSARQLRTVKARDHTRLNVQSLFGVRTSLLYKHWPRHNKEGEVTGWAPEQVAEALLNACARVGVWDAVERVRGPGAWVGEHGELIIHCGDKLFQGHPPTGGQRLGRIESLAEPGKIGHYVYPAAPAKARPHPDPVPGGEGGPGHELLSMLRTWNWRRGATDAHLMLGWLAAAMIGGALDWRPLAWVTGDRSTGKSTLQKLLHNVLGGAVVSVSDASAAGIWQRIGHASLPVALDELEAEEDNRRQQNIIKLARQASSGGVLLRGGADHKGFEFTARNCFLFSSILIPPLMGQDRSRMAILELAPLTDAKPPSIDPKHYAELGRRLRRRLIDGWPRMAETLETYRQALAANGHGARGADQFGTILACADLVLHDHMPSADELDDWGSRLEAQDMAERDDDAPDHARCLAWLITSSDEGWRSGQKRMVGEWVAQAAGRTPAGYGDPIEAQQVLARFGLQVMQDKDLKKMDQQGRTWLAVATNHQGTAGLFQGSHWASKSGASGVWSQALRRCDGAVPWGCLRFNGVPARAVLIPIDAVLQTDPLDAPRTNDIMPEDDLYV